MELHLKNKKALITGSSGGIGEAIAKSLAKEGVHVMVHGRNEKEFTWEHLDLVPLFKKYVPSK